MPTIIKKYELILTEVATNNNKFWRGILFDDGSGKSEWGRVGYGTSETFYPTHQIVEKKMKEKIKKGYTELKIVNSEGVSTSTNPSRNVAPNSGNIAQIARSEILKSGTSNTTLSRLIDRFVTANVHTITANTQITYNSTTGLFATPMGIITMDGLTEARNILAEIAPLVRNKEYNDQLNVLVSRYLRIIPQNVGMKLKVVNLLPDDNAIQKQNDLLDALDSSYQALTTQPAPTSDAPVPSQKVFKVDVDVLADSSERTRLTARFERSKKSMHNYNNVNIREIFTVNIHDMTNNYESRTTPHQEVFHGTSQSNVLSILKSGLKVSPPSTAVIAGKLYGNGIYGSTCSSKSIGYTFGRWGQGASEHGYLFICDFALGNVFYPKTYKASKPSGYDSIWAKPENTGLHNDELIVYRNNQVKIKYLLEIK